MAKDTINLNKGLRAWYNLGTSYYDDQRGLLQDVSGYGEHLEARGSPSIGVPGPGGFEATDFDETDDYFYSDRGIDVDAVSLTAIFKWDDDPNTTADNDVMVVASSNTAVGEYTMLVEENEEITFKIDTSSNTYGSQEKLQSRNEWGVVTGMYDPDEAVVQLAYEGEVYDLEATNGNPISTSADFRISTNTTNTVFGGRIAAVAVHDRKLNQAERAYIQRLTGPRRSML